MTCTQCRREIEAESAFCPHCGASIDTASAAAPRRLTRRSSEGRLGGVCAGIAEFLRVDVTLVRLVWVILSIVPGGIFGGIVAYIAAWIVMPDDMPARARTPSSGRRLTRSASDRKIAGVCGGLAAYFAVDPTVVRLIWAMLTIVPGAVVLGVLAYAVAWVVIPEAGSASTSVISSAA
jgi:phage shock protein PspC (stress-responsive transcriptional regulator)